MLGYYLYCLEKKNTQLWKESLACFHKIKHTWASWILNWVLNLLVVLMSMAFQERVSQLFGWPRATALMLHHINMPPAMIQNRWAEGWMSVGHLGWSQVPAPWVLPGSLLRPGSCEIFLLALPEAFAKKPHTRKWPFRGLLRVPWPYIKPLLIQHGTCLSLFFKQLYLCN